MTGSLRFDEMNPDDPMIVGALLAVALFHVAGWLWRRGDEALDVF